MMAMMLMIFSVEASLFSAELLGALQSMITQVVRTRGTYKNRADKTVRAFGGVNIVMFADFWQLHPVTGAYLCNDPTMLPTHGLASNAMTLFWESGRDTVRGFTELDELMRCQDAWFNNVLKQCRDGYLQDDDYCYLHGLPT